MKKILFFSGLFLIVLLLFLVGVKAWGIFGETVGHSTLYDFFKQPWWLLVPEFGLMAYVIVCLSYKRGRLMAKRYFDQALKNA